MQVLHCRNCQKENIKDIATFINLEISKYCEHCHHSHSYKHNFYFCCVECMLQYTDEHREEFLKEVKKFKNNIE